MCTYTIYNNDIKMDFRVKNIYIWIGQQYL